jgi:putative transposase
MGLRIVELIDKEYYHLYNRGNGKCEIFLDNEDYDRFVKLLYVCNSEYGFKFRDSITDLKIDAFEFERGNPLVSVIAWVLMPNHFHIFLISHRSDLWEKGYNPITEFMRKLSTAYAMYFNKKYNRTGSLFEGKFKSKHVGEDNYYKYLFAYMHLNPIKLIQKDWKENGVKDKMKAVAYLNNYKYSSFLDYFKGSNRRYSKIIDQDELPEEFKKAHANELFEWLTIDTV